MVENKDDPVDPVNPVDPVETALDKLKPALQKLTFGSVMGYCSGMALKKVGRVVAFCVGAGFVVVQSAVYAGYIQVDWNKVKDDALKPLDTTGDGKVDMEDIKTWWTKVKDILTYNIPDATGFSLGFLTGVRYG